MTKSLVASLAALAVLGGCVSVNHLESQQRMYDGIERLHEAEQQLQRRERWLIKNEPDDLAAISSESFPLIVEDLRRTLASDAAEDIKAAADVTSSASAADRVSSLFRAAIKGWHAGEEGADVVDEASERSKSLCDPSRPARPERDCFIISIADTLNSLETQADIILPFNAIENSKDVDENMPVEEVQSLASAITEISVKLGRLANPPGGARKDFKPWLGRERLGYLCWAVRGLDALDKIQKKLKARIDDAPGWYDGAKDNVNRELTAFHRVYPGAIDTDPSKNLKVKERKYSPTLSGSSCTEALQELAIGS